jgi:hypothetical protein
MQNMKPKLKEWLERYGWAEVVSLLLTVIASWLTFELTQDKVTTALVGTWIGNIGYFGIILTRDILLTINQLKKVDGVYSWKILSQNLKSLLVEFGIAELFDSFFLRPTLMYYLPLWVDNLSLGVIMAKLLADITFYIPAIIGYELSKKKLRNIV